MTCDKAGCDLGHLGADTLRYLELEIALIRCQLNSMTTSSVMKISFSPSKFKTDRGTDPVYLIERLPWFYSADVANSVDSESLPHHASD